MAYHGISWRILAYVGISLWHVMAMAQQVMAYHEYIDPWHKGKEDTHPGGGKKTHAYIPSGYVKIAIEAMAQSK